MKEAFPNVLIVEDDDLLAEVLRLAFSEIEANLMFASSLAEAERLIADHWPHLAIIDIGLPDGNGFEFAKSHFTGVPDKSAPALLFLTGRTDRRTRMSAYTLNTIDYITKPFSMSELTMKTHNILSFIANSAPVRTELPDCIAPNTQLPLLNRIYDVCEQHCDNPDFSIRDAAQLVGLSVRSLQRSLRNETGKNFSSILTATRMQRAKVLLDNKITPQRVAVMCGYRHPENFSHAFKRVVLKTPKEYQHQENQ